MAKRVTLTEVVKARVSKQDLAAVERIAKRNDQKPAYVVRKAIREFIATHQKNP